MAKLDLQNIAYLMFRLMPIILPSYFILSSIFAQDLKAFIYLAGLLFASVVAIFTSNWIPTIAPDIKGISCNLIRLGETSPISNIPLSMVVYAYTFCYLLYVLIVHKLISQNIPTMVVFPLLIIADFYWNITNTCSTLWQLLAGALVGGGIGVLWAYMIDAGGIAKLQYFNGLSNRQYCTMPTSQTYKCDVSRD